MNRAEILRQKVTRLVQLLVAKKIQVTQRGSKAYVEWDKVTFLPKRVNIPYIPDDATEEFCSAIEGFLDHEVGHLLFTDSTAVKRAIKNGVGDLANIVEDIYIERRMSEQFTGSKANLSSVGKFFVENYTKPNVKKDPDNATGYLLIPAFRSWSGQTVFTDFMNDNNYWGVIDKVAKRIEAYCKSVLPTIRDSQHATDIAIEIKKLLTDPPPQKGKPNGGKGDTPEDEGESDNNTPSTSKEADAGDDEQESQDESKQPASSDKEDENDKPEDESSDDGESGEVGEGDEEETDETDSADEQEGQDSQDNDGVDDIKVDSDAEPDAEDAEGEETDSVGSTEATDGDDGKDGEESTEGEGDEGESEASDEEIDSQDGDKPEEIEQGSTGEENKSSYNPEDYEPIDVDQLTENLKDYDESISEALTKDSLEFAHNADYIVYTKEQDFIDTLPDAYTKHVPDSYVERMQNKVDHMVAPLQKDLERAVAARSQAVWTGGHRKGRINGNALTRLINTNDDRVFKQKQDAQTKATAVSLVVDCSGSMRSGSEPGSSPITTAAYTAYALAAVLERLSIKCEVSGFTTGDDIMFDPNDHASRTVNYSRGSALFLPIFKGFNERLDPVTKKRIASLADCRWMSENVDGESVEIAGNRLLQRTEERKILIVLSDGLPSCTPGSTSALRTHLAKVVKTFEKGGVDVLGIGIEDDNVRKFYSKCVVLNNVGELPTRVIGEVKKLLMK